VALDVMLAAGEWSTAPHAHGEQDEHLKSSIS
jgi:hypothetical protein